MGLGRCATAQAQEPVQWERLSALLALRFKPRKRLKRDKPDVLAVPDAPNVTWSMDFMADRLGDPNYILLLSPSQVCLVDGDKYSCAFLLKLY